MRRSTVLPSPVDVAHGAERRLDHRGRRRQRASGSVRAKQYEPLGGSARDRLIASTAARRVAMASSSSCRRGRRRARSTESPAARRAASRCAPGWPRCRPRRRSSACTTRPVRSPRRSVRSGDRRGSRRRRRGGSRRPGDRHDQASMRRQRRHRNARPGDAGRGADPAGVPCGDASRAPTRRAATAPTTPRSSRRSGGRVVVVAGRADQPQDHRSRRSRVGAATIGRGEVTDGRDMRVGQGFDIHRFSDDPARRPGARRGAVRRRTRPRRSQRRRRRRPRRAPTRCSAPPASATSASTSPTPTRAGRAPTRSSCCATSSTCWPADAWVPVNVDCAVVCERPKLAPRRDEMQSTLTSRRRRTRVGQGEPGREDRCDRCR